MRRPVSIPLLGFYFSHVFSPTRDVKMRTLYVGATCQLYRGRPRLLNRLHVVLRDIRARFFSGKMAAAVQGALGGVGRAAGEGGWGIFE